MAEKSDSTLSTTNTDDKGKVTDTTKTDIAPDKTFDPSALSDDQIGKVFDDPRLWQHSRFKQLNDRAKQAERLEKEKAKADEKKLEDEKQWQALAEKRQSELDELKKQVSQQKIDNAIQAEAVKSGAVDIEAVTKLLDRAKITIDDAGTISGVSDAVKGLIEAKPYLKGGTPKTTVGNGTNPPADGNNAPQRFKASQLNDTAFYQAHEKEIDKALRLGLIDDDTV